MRRWVPASVTEVGGRLEFGTPKTHQQRTVPLPATLAESLARHCEGKQGDGLLMTTASGTVLRLRNWRRAVFDPAVRTAGLSDVTPHDLRHTAASLAVASGATVKSVQRMLGHASAAMTLDVYSVRRRPDRSGRPDGRRRAVGRGGACGRRVGDATSPQGV